MSNVFYVYVLFRPWNGVPCYVGKGKGARWLAHDQRPTNKHLANIIAKAGGAELPKVKIRQWLREEDAFIIEQSLIRAIGRGSEGPLVNLTDGGEGPSGLQFTESSLAKMRDSHLGKPRSSQAIEKHRAKMIGRAVSAETREKISAAQRGRKYPDRLPWNKGKTFSPETKEKMRQAKLGRTVSAEQRAKISASNLGKKRDPSVGQKISAAKMGKKWSPENRAKLRAGNRSRDPEVRARISAATRIAMAKLKQQRLELQ